MTINTLKELQALVKFCRKVGIASIEVDGIKLALGDAPTFSKKLNSEQPIEETQTYTDQDMMYWSSTGAADNG